MSMRFTGHHVAILMPLLCGLFAGRAAALPGFVDLVQDVDPEAPKACAACHDPLAGPQSHETVTARGFELYAGIKAIARRNELTVESAVPFERVDLAVFGDTRTNASAHRQVVRAICGENPEMALHTGDMVEDGRITSQWTQATLIEACLIEPKLLQHSCGNHEGAYCVDNPVRRALGNLDRWYTVEYKGWTFVAIDSNDVSSAQMAWLNALPTGKRYVPFFHHPPYPTLAGHSGDADVKSRLVPWFKQRGVKLVLSGHNHGYDRSEVDGIAYVTAGGGGAPLYPCGRAQAYTKACIADFSYVACEVDESAITCVAKRASDGSVIDSFAVQAP